jgi:hypothetical protein
LQVPEKGAKGERQEGGCLEREEAVREETRQGEATKVSPQILNEWTSAAELPK